MISLAPSWLLLAAVVLGSAAGSAAATGLVTVWLRRRAILDHPNERSSHAVPTPRGGGWGILLVLVPGWAALGLAWPVLGGVVGLAALSWLDDRRSLPPGPRLLGQALAVAAGLSALGGDQLVFQGWLPWGADRAVAAVCWLWFINLFNFMDGIDGLAGSEAATIAVGLALGAGLAGGGASALPALVLAGAAVGFLVWNWQPARVFMGDVGSVPLGFALGWLLLSAAGDGYWPASLLLPLYFVTDATVTLLRRLLAGKRVWQAHREHFYQRAVQGGRSHGWVVCRVLAANLLLIVLATLALAVPDWRWPALTAGGGVVLVLLWRLYGATTAPLPRRQNAVNVTSFHDEGPRLP